MRRVLFFVFLWVASSAWAGLSPKQIYQKMGPGVVFIAAQHSGDNNSTCGTGSILTSNGLVLTNAHVVINPETGRPYSALSVFLKPAKLTGDLRKDLAKPLAVKVLAFDTAMDLAVLKLQAAPDGLTALKLGDPNVLQPGDQTVAIGHPEQGGLWTLTTGVLSAEIKDQNGVKGRDTWQMETSLNRGNSGGPLFDPRGYVIGVNTSIARKAEDGLAITGISFAIKSSSAKAWLASKGYALDYGSLPLDELAIAQAYDLASKPVPATPTPAVEDSAPDTAVPTGLSQTTAVTLTPEASKGEKRQPIEFKDELEQAQRPYSQEQMNAFLQGLMIKRDKAVDELDESVRK